MSSWKHKQTCIWKRNGTGTHLHSLTTRSIAFGFCFFSNSTTAGNASKTTLGSTWKIRMRIKRPKILLHETLHCEYHADSKRMDIENKMPQKYYYMKHSIPPTVSTMSMWTSKRWILWLSQLGIVIQNFTF